MKTLTEFDGFTLKRGLQKMAELASQGKTAEETPALLTEAFKYEGDKLKFFQSALEMAQARGATAEDCRVKRVVVLTLQEGEKAPQGAVQSAEHHYLLEFFPAPPRPQRKGEGRFAGKGKRGRGGKGRRGGGRGREAGGREGSAASGGSEQGPQGDRPKGGERPGKGRRFDKNRGGKPQGPQQPLVLPKPLATPVQVAPAPDAETKPVPVVPSPKDSATESSS